MISRKHIETAAVIAAAVSILTMLALLVAAPILFQDSRVIAQASEDGALTDRPWRDDVPGVLGAAIVAAAFPASRAQDEGVAAGAGANVVSHGLIARYRPVRTWETDLMAPSLAALLDLKFSDDALVRAYARTADFGRDAAGADAGAQAWFAKPVAALSLGEAAFLASVPAGPGAIDPAVTPDRAQDRRDGVLSRMRARGFISQSDYEQAIAQPLEVVAR